MNCFLFLHHCANAQGIIVEDKNVISFDSDFDRNFVSDAYGTMMGSTKFSLLFHRSAEVFQFVVSNPRVDSVYCLANCHCLNSKIRLHETS